MDPRQINQRDLLTVAQRHPLLIASILIIPSVLGWFALVYLLTRLTAGVHYP